MGFFFGYLKKNRYVEHFYKIISQQKIKCEKENKPTCYPVAAGPPPHTVNMYKENEDLNSHKKNTFKKKQYIGNPPNSQHQQQAHGKFDVLVF